MKRRLNSKIERKLISNIITQLVSLSLKKNARYHKTQEELQEVLSNVSKQNWKMCGYIDYDVTLTS